MNLFPSSTPAARKAGNTVRLRTASSRKKVKTILAALQNRLTRPPLDTFSSGGVQTRTAPSTARGAFDFPGRGCHMIDRRSQFMCFAFLLSDLTLTALAWLGAYLLRFESGLFAIFADHPAFSLCRQQ